MNFYNCVYFYNLVLSYVLLILTLVLGDELITINVGFIFHWLDRLFQLILLMGFVDLY